MTPTTRNGRFSIVTVRPTTRGSPPNRRIHRPWLSTATGSPPIGDAAVSNRLRAISSSVKTRPCAAGTPSSEKKSAVTCAASTTSDWSPSVSVRPITKSPAIPRKLPACRRQSDRLPEATPRRSPPAAAFVS